MEALSYLAADPGRLSAFMAETGLAPDTIREAAAGPGFLPALLDYLLGKEALLLGFAAEQDIDPGAIAAARAALSPARRDG